MIGARSFVTIDDPRWTQCHASSLAWVDGPVVAWFAGTREGADDNRVVVRHAGGEQVLPSATPAAHWNPVLWVDPGGGLWLFYKVGPRISAWRTLVVTSDDGGRSWSDPRELVADDRSGGRGPVKNPPVVAPDGAWLAPGSVEAWSDPPRWDAFVDRSDDGGRTWAKAEIAVDRDGARGAGVIQPALWRGADDTVVALMRSTEGRAFRSSSTDAGRTWDVATPTGLPNNNSGLAAVRLPSGRVACVHNPGSDDWGARCPLVLSTSDDDGRTWARAGVLDDGATPVDPDVPQTLDGAPVPGRQGADTGVVTSGVAEYSYPSALVVGDDLWVTYTWQRRGIVLARVSLDDVDTG